MSRDADLPQSYQLERLLWAFQGLSDVLNPDQVLDSEERSHISTLVEILTERLETILHRVMTPHATLLAELQQARASQAPTPSASTGREGAPHV